MKHDRDAPDVVLCERPMDASAINTSAGRDDLVVDRIARHTGHQRPRSTATWPLRLISAVT